MTIKKRSVALLVLMGLVVAGLLLAQSGTGTVKAQQPDGMQGVFQGVLTVENHDVSPPLRDMVRTPYKGTLNVPAEERASGLEGPLGSQDADGATQSVLGGGEIPAPTVSFDAQPNVAGVSPPDPVGDVGPNHYVAMSNLHTQIFTKTGASVLGPFPNNQLWAGFGGACQSENSGDPIVLHDQFRDRWILMQFTSAGPTYYLCIAASATPDPSGSLIRYAINTGNQFPDYPKMGVWGDALILTGRNFAGSSFAGVGVYAVNLPQLYAGVPAPTTISMVIAPTPAYNVGDGLLPADVDGNVLPPAGSPAYLMGSMDNGGPYGAPQDALTLWKFAFNWANPPSSTVTLANTIPTQPFDSMFAGCSGRSCIPQPGTTNKIDHLGYRQRPMHRLAYRNYGTHESLVTNQGVEVSSTMTGIRWWEIRSPNASPIIYQEGTYAPGLTDGTHRWMGSIAMDAVGNMGLGYSASSSTVFPSSWYTGRLVTDPAGTMPQGEGQIVNGTGSQTGSQRWGDYTSMNIDPVDDCTFWYVNEYVPTTSSVGWRLRVGAFKFPSCVQGPTPTPTVTATGTLPTATPTNSPTLTSTPTLTATPVGPGCGGAIAIPATGTTTGPASPYPSTISLSGLGTSITDLNIVLNGLSHTYPDDIDMMLVAPNGTTNAVFMSDVGGSTSAVNVNLTIDDEAATQLADAGPLVSGTFRPNNVGTGDTFNAPAPAPSANMVLSTFDGQDPNGTWSLYIMDDASGDSGNLSSWCLQVVAGGTPTPTASPTSSATATASQTPTATATVPGGPTVTVTPPPTSIEMSDFSNAGTPYGGWLLSIAGLALLAFGIVARRRR